MDTGILILDSQPSVALVRDSQLIFLIDIDKDNVLQESYNYLHSYALNSLKVLIKPTISTDIVDKDIPLICDLKSLDVNGSTNYLIISKEDMIKMNDLSNALGATSLEVYNEIDYYINSFLKLSSKDCIITNDWQDNYLITVIKDNSIKEFIKSTRLNFSKLLSKAMIDYNLPEVKNLKEYYNIMNLRESIYNYKEIDKDCYPTLSILSYMISNEGKIIQESFDNIDFRSSESEQDEEKPVKNRKSKIVKDKEPVQKEGFSLKKFLGIKKN